MVFVLSPFIASKTQEDLKQFICITKEALVEWLTVKKQQIYIFCHNWLILLAWLV